jgi:putative flippase GtrA
MRYRSFQSSLLPVSTAFSSKRVLGQTIRYGIVVGCGYLFAVALYSGELAVGIPPYVGFGIAFVLNGLLNFSLLRAWAFPPSGRGVWSDLARFSVVAAMSFVVNYLSFACLYSLAGIGAATSQRAAIVIAAPVTFLASRMWSFRARRPELPASADLDGADDL